MSYHEAKEMPLLPFAPFIPQSFSSAPILANVTNIMFAVKNDRSNIPGTPHPILMEDILFEP